MALQAREPNIEGQGEISMSDLVWQSLRMSPDRVIVGEVRGPEVIPLTNAMSMGNDGSMGTLHSSSSQGAFTKLAAYAVQGPERLPIEATNLLVAAALHFVVHLDKPRDDDGKRVVSSVREVVGADGAQIISNEVLAPRPGPAGCPGRAAANRHRRPARRSGLRPGPLRPARWVVDAMTTTAALFGLLGAGVAVGVLLVVVGWRGQPADATTLRRPGIRVHALRPEDRCGRLAGRSWSSALAIGVFTGWVVGAVLSVLAVLGLPRILGSNVDHQRQLERIEAIAGWTEMLRDTLVAAAGLEQAILATASTCPEPIREEITELAVKLERGERLAPGLRDLADQLHDPTADLVISALVLASDAPGPPARGPARRAGRRGSRTGDDADARRCRSRPHPDQRAGHRHHDASCSRPAWWCSTATTSARSTPRSVSSFSCSSARSSSRPSRG